MKRPYFADDVKWEQCENELRSWIGTPYRHLQMTKGYGADCTLFIAAAWRNIGILKRVVYDYYPKDWHKNTTTEFVMRGLFTHFNEHMLPGISLDIRKGREDGIDLSELMRGDMLGFSIIGRGSTLTVTNHTSIALPGNKMIHAASMGKKGVTISSLGRNGQWWNRKMTYALRIMIED